MSRQEMDEFETSLAMKQNASARGKLVVQFYEREVQNQKLSDESGRPIYEPQDFIRILTPGDRDNMVDRLVWIGRNPACDNVRYPQDWEAFQKKADAAPVGTPLEQCPIFSRVQVAELKHLNVFTVEQLSQLSDSLTGKFMGLQTLKQRAKDWLDVAEGGNAVAHIRTENDELKAKNSMLERQLRDLAARVAGLEDEPASAGEEVDPPLAEKAPVKKAAPVKEEAPSFSGKAAAMKKRRQEPLQV